MTQAAPSSLTELAQAMTDSSVEQVRFVWCDLHGLMRGKTLTRPAALKAVQSGVSMVSTLMLKDTSDRTAFKVFEPGIGDELPGFGYANNLLLHPIAETWRVLPWAKATGWVQCQPHFSDGSRVPYDSRHQLLGALSHLHGLGLEMVCGLEVEFHIYRLHDGLGDPAHDPMQSDWPPPAPELRLIHPGYMLLSESWADRAHEPLEIVRRTAQALNMPLSSLEIELGPSQVEAVFEATNALTAADNMVLFRSAVRQALHREGYLATFMCRPPFPHIMSSGWHLHQSLVDRAQGRPLFVAESSHSAPPALQDAQSVLSDTGCHYLAGLLAHGRAMTALCSPTANAYGRFRPHALAPQLITWGQDNRGAMLRVIGPRGHPATRIENRLGEPAANPYLYFASQIHAGLDGLARGLMPPPATVRPYASDQKSIDLIPDTLEQALTELSHDPVLVQGFGAEFIRYFCRLKGSEAARHAAAVDAIEFDRREYLARL